MQQENPQNPLGTFAEKETEAQRVQRVRVEEQKRHAVRTMEQLKQRFGE